MTMTKLLLLIILGFSLAVNGLADSGADTAFFSKVHLGMTIDEAQSRYRKLGNVTAMWHSGAPAGQEQVDFRTDTSPQRRIYVYYSQADNKIVSVFYWKLGDGETFSKAEQDHLVHLNGDPKNLSVTVLTDDTTIGTEFEVTTPKQFELEAANHQ